MDLGEQFLIDKVAVQGRGDDNGNTAQRVTAFKLLFSNDGTTFQEDNNEGQVLQLIAFRLLDFYDVLDY